MEKMLIIGTDGTVVPRAIEYCKQHGIYTIITDFTPVENRPMKLLSDSYWMIDTKDFDALEKRCKEEHVTGIFAGCNEFFLDCARTLAKRLGLPYQISDEMWRLARDKKAFKQACIDAGLDVPHEYELSADSCSEEELEKIQYPVIVKPIDGSSSIGIYRCENREELVRNIDLAKQVSVTSRIIIEDYIEGTFVSAFVYYDGHVLSAPLVCPTSIQKIDGCDLAEVEFYSPRYTRELMATMGTRVQQFFQGIELLPGTFFFQAIYQNGKFYLLELNGRIGGPANLTAGESFYFDYIGATVEIIMGHPVPQIGDLLCETRYSEENDNVVAYYYCKHGVVKEIHGLDAVKRISGVSIFFDRVWPGARFVRPESMLQIGYYFLIHSESEDELFRKIRLINETLHVIDENGREMLVPIEDFAQISANR